MNVDVGCSNDYSDYMCDEILKRQDLAYDIPNYRTTLRMLKTNNPTASAVRAPGLSQAAVIAETMVDAVSRACKVSQETVREVSMKASGKDGGCDQTFQPMPDWHTPEVWKKGKEQFSFEDRQKACDSYNSGSKFKKRALALMPLKYSVGYVNMTGLAVTVNINASDGSVEVQTGCCEMGQGCLTKVMSCVATELGVPMATVNAHYPDTSVIPNLFTDGGSAGSELLCQAAKQACDQLKARLAEVKEVLLEEKKAASTDGGDVSATHQEVCARAFGAMPTDSRVCLSATGVASQPFYNDLKRTPEHPPLGGIWWQMDPLPKDIWQYYLSGVGCSEVEVDVLTGNYVILRSDIMIDAGKSLNPLIDLGQAEGGFVYGIGNYCTEETLMDPKDGRNKSEGSWNYKPPNNKDVPQIFNVELLPGHSSDRTLYGSKGIGEAPLLLAYSVVSAVKKAIRASREERGLSSDFRLDSPATCDRVQQAMGVQPSHLSLN
jgi:xanthine dehydrogenase molybdopterin-binding subunit B